MAVIDRRSKLSQYDNAIASDSTIAYAKFGLNAIGGRIWDVSVVNNVWEQGYGFLKNPSRYDIYKFFFAHL
jgi:hypothetical protein